MPTMTIYHGKLQPMRVTGKNQCRMLAFAEQYRGWHTYATDKPTKRALDALVKKGYITTNEFGQFRFTYPKGA